MDPEFLNTDVEHQHDRSMSSISITVPGELDLDEVQNFVGDVLQYNGNDIYRMKGVLNIAGAPNRYVYQAVHMIYNASFDQPWGADECRDNRLVFIGKNLNKQGMTERFNECILTPEKREAKRQLQLEMINSLRFSVGDRVALLYRQEGIRTALG